MARDQTATPYGADPDPETPVNRWLAALVNAFGVQGGLAAIAQVLFPCVHIVCLDRQASEMFATKLRLILYILLCRDTG